MGSSKRKSRSETNCPLPTGWDLKQLPNCHRKERDFIRCKMHELVSKNKIGSPLVATNFIPGKWVIWVSDSVLWDLDFLVDIASASYSNESRMKLNRIIGENMNDCYWQWNNQSLPVTFKAHIYTCYTPFKFFVAYVHVVWSVYTSDTKQSWFLMTQTILQLIHSKVWRKGMVVRTL